MVQYEREKPLQNMMMDYSIHKVSFLNFITRFLRLFLIQLIFMWLYEVGICPNCRNPMPSPRNIKILIIGDGYVIAAN